ncbi:YraN family protein [Thalassovita sp.]|uniref:YraN family protein n=1 Tax=Thalassovita sp. TaxID=1979401 RepID=UPI002B271E47|nr:YraN family protein [Thalassovita sp.]
MAVQGETGQTKPEAKHVLRGKVAYLSGLAAEEQVAAEYQTRGYILAHTRWRGSCGEVDLIFADGDGFVFVEVKKSRSFDRAAERLGRAQIARLCSAAEDYLAQHDRSLMTDLRFDVALVNTQGAIRIIENAFGHF